MATHLIAPGWYADPANQAQYLRWWDGATWTGHTHPVPYHAAASFQSSPAAEFGSRATTDFKLAATQQQDPRRPVIPPWPAARQSTGAKVLIGVAAGVGGLVLLLVVAAVAIPVFLNQRGNALAARTTISMPATAAGLVQLNDPASQKSVRQALDLVRGSGRVGKCQCAFGIPTASLYGTPAGQRRALVVVTRATLSSADQASFLKGARESAGAAAVNWHSAPAGPLGGQVMCAALPTRNATACVFVDPGAAGDIAVLGTTNGDELAAELRTAVEHRT